jgi:hypothetical protein
MDGGDGNVVFGEKFAGEKRNLRRCIAVMQQPIILSPKFGMKSSQIFMQLM